MYAVLNQRGCYQLIIVSKFMCKDGRWLKFYGFHTAFAPVGVGMGMILVGSGWV